MPEIFRLTLPREVTPAFPDYCIVCGRPEPGHQASLFAAEMRHGHSFRESYSLKVPCCVGCAVRLHMRRLVSGFAPLLIVVGGGDNACGVRDMESCVSPRLRCRAAWQPDLVRVPRLRDGTGVSSAQSAVRRRGQPNKRLKLAARIGY